MHGRKVLKRVALGLITTIVLLVTTLTGAGIFLLRTESGRAMLLEGISSALNSPNLHIELSGLGEEALSRVTLAGLKIGDFHGTWLDISDILIEPDLTGLLHGQLRFLRVEARQIHWKRLPQTEKSPAKGASAALPAFGIAHFHFPQLELDAPVSGLGLSLRAKGDLTTTGQETLGALHLGLRDTPEDLLRGKMVLNHATQNLSAELHVLEASDGVLHRLLHVTDTAEIRIVAQGAGALQAWPLTLKASLPGITDMQVNATLNIPEVEGELSAELAPGQRIRTSLSGLPDAPMNLFGQGRWTVEGLHVPQIRLASAFGAIDGTGSWTSGQLNATVQTAGLDLGWLHVENLGAGKLHGNASISMQDKLLYGQTALNLTDWTLAGSAVRSGNLTANLVYDEAGWNATGNASISGSLPLEQTSATASFDLNQHKERLSLASLTLHSDKLLLNGNGTLSGQDLNATARLEAAALQLASLRLSGATEVTAQGTLVQTKPTFSGKIQAALSNLAGLPEIATQLLGKNPTITADVILSPDQLHFTDTTLDAPLALQTNGTVSELKAFSAQFAAQCPDIPNHILRLPAGLQITGHAHGEFGYFQTLLHARSTQGTLLNRSFGPTSLTINATLPQAPDAEFHMDSSSAGVPMHLGGHMRLENGILNMDKLSLTAPATSVNATAALAFPALRFSAQTQGTSSKLQELAPLLGMDLAGELAAKASFETNSKAPAAHLEARGRNLQIFGALAHEATVELDCNPMQPLRTLRGILQADSISILEQQVDQIRLTSQPNEHELQLQAHLQAGSNQLHAKAAFIAQGEEDQLSFTDFSGLLWDQKIILITPWRLQHAKNRTSWNDLNIRIGNATLNAQGNIDNNVIAARASFGGLDLSRLRPLWPPLPMGMINAEANLRGTLTAPELDYQAKAEGLRVEGIKDSPALTLDTSGSMKNNLLHGTAELHGSNASMDGRAEVTLPILFSLTPVTLSVLPQAPLSGSCVLHAGLSMIPPLLGLDDQSMSGKTDVNFKLGGTISSPVLTGMAEIHDATYEHFRFGTRLRHVEGNLAAHGTHVEMNATADDGGAGNSTGQAQARGRGDLQEHSATLDVQLNNFRLLRMDTAQGTASGDLRFHITDNRPTLGGKLTLMPLNIQIPKSMPPEFVRIAIEERGNPYVKPAKQAAALPPIAMNLGLSMPAQCFVSGRGLNSEWSGNLDIRGTSAAPQISGALQLLHGRFEFLDRTFDLTKGALAFDGSLPPNPYLDISAQSQIQDTTAMVQITGPASQFQLVLSSVPALPSDEILAMILFGRSSRQLSPLQAVRLAQAAAEFTGIEAGPDVLDKFKKTLGLQNIEMGRDAKNNPTIGVGGYFGGKYYIRTERTVSGEDSTRVEIQITPQLRLETEVGTDSRQGAGVTWQKDY